MISYFDKFKDMESTLNLDNNDKSDLEKEVLVYSTGKKIFMKDFDNKTYIIIRERDDDVRSLCSHKGILYDAGYNQKIIETLTNKIISKRDGGIESLYSYNGWLYDCGEYPGVYDTLKNQIFIDQENRIKDLCFHKKELFVIMNDKIFSKQRELEDKTRIKKIVSFNEDLIYLTEGNDIISYSVGHFVKPKKKIKHRILPTYNLAVHNNELYDVSGNTIYKTLTDEVITKESSPIKAMCFHSRQDFVDAGILEKT
ncbi:hypothetical protein KY334_06415 [Candidatus Woesearchaeota archaeon]|nr:hypothetical protein [Candidatus Woesearchaeota archaeon]